MIVWRSCGLAVALLGCAHAVPQGPKFSWDTLPVFFHSSNASGPYTHDAVVQMARFPMVTIEKFQGPCGYGQNATPACHQEDLIVAELKKVKMVNPNVSTVFYYNSVLDFPQYQLHARMLEDPSLTLHDKNGKQVTMSGGGHQCDVFDFGNSKTRQLFIETCYNATLTGYVDGCFVDRAVDGTPTDSGNDTIPSASKYNLSNQTAQAYFDGHIKVLTDLQTAIGEGPVIANHAYGPPHDALKAGSVNFAMIETFGPNQESINQLLLAAANNRGVQAHAKGTVHDLAAFLVGAGYRAYYGLGGWSGDGDVSQHWLACFEEPLGEPHGPATLSADGVYTRHFGTNVTATFDTKTNQGTIVGWNNLPPTPPPPPPPAPAPPLQPQCGKPLLNTGQADAEISNAPATSPEACCSKCINTEHCVIWAYHAEEKPPRCHLHTAAATSNPHVGCTSGHLVNTTTPVVSV